MGGWVSGKVSLSYDQFVSLVTVILMTEESKKAMILKHGTMDGSRDHLMDHIKGQTCWEECNQNKAGKRMADTQLYSPAPKRAHQDTSGQRSRHNISHRI